jgi:hypothetical protein
MERTAVLAADKIGKKKKFDDTCNQKLSTIPLIQVLKLQKSSFFGR